MRTYAACKEAAEKVVVVVVEKLYFMSAVKLFFLAIETKFFPLKLLQLHTLTEYTLIHLCMLSIAYVM